MSLIEVQHIQDKANEKMREIMLKERIDKIQKKRMKALEDPDYSMSSDSQEDQYLSPKERYEKKKLEASKRKGKQLTYREIFEREKIEEYNRRQKLFNQVKYTVGQEYD